MTMRTLTYQVSFNSPAFLGNAEQQAQWRTPPFKALLRQWWRVVKAADVGYDHHQLLQLENSLFGSAVDGSGSSRSQVQLRLSNWDVGKIPAGKDSVELKYVAHGEIDPRTFPPHKGEKKVRADVYLGYGPIGRSSAIEPGTFSNTLRIRVPADFAKEISDAMQLAAWFGTVGSRSRNGWGALTIEGEELEGYDGLSDSGLLKISTARPLRDSLGLDWPHSFALREDGKLSVWRVGKINRQAKSIDGFDTWRQTMEELARIKIGFRTALKFPSESSPHVMFQDRHVLAYPVTNHKVKGIDDQKRLSNSLRLKVHCRGSKFFAVIAHLPCGIPAAFTPNSPPVDFQQRVWVAVHQMLDTGFPDSVTRIKKGIQ